MKKWGPILIGVMIIGGFSVGFYLAKVFMVPDLPDSMLFAGVGGSVLGVGIVLGLQKLKEVRKKNQVPEIDERTWINIKNFYAISLYVFLFASMLLVCVMFALGYETIELGLLSIYLIIVFMLIVVGTQIVKRQ